MGRKNILPAHLLLNDQSLAPSWASNPVTVTTATRVAFNVATSGVTDNAGVFSVEYRVYKDDRNYSAWTSLTLDSAPTLADDDANILIDVNVPPGQVRLVFTQAQVEVQTLTFPAKDDSDDGDYVVIYDSAGTPWAIALDKTGLAAQEPTGDAWDAVDASNKVYADISGGTTAASVAALAEAALDGLTGFTAVILTDDSAADGTMLLTLVVPGAVTNPSPHSFDDGDAGSITGAETSAADGSCDVWVTGCQEGG
jgi:hypothetical protein